MLLMSIRPRSTVDELASAKKQALTAAFASMALYLFLDNFVSFHIASVKEYSASFDHTRLYLEQLSSLAIARFEQPIESIT